MTAARKITTWAGTIAGPLLLTHSGLPLLGAVLAVVIILAGLYCWTVSSDARSRRAAMLRSAGQAGRGPALRPASTAGPAGQFLPTRSR